MRDPSRPYAVPPSPYSLGDEAWAGMPSDDEGYPPSSWDEGWGVAEGDPDDDSVMLTEVVFVEGQLIDTRRRPARGTPYEAIASELREARRPAPRVTYVQTPPPPHHEPMLAWLDRVVGGRDALLHLDVVPLPAEELDLAAFRTGDRARLTDLDRRISATVDRLVSGPLATELRTAIRRLMVRLLTADRFYLARSERDDLIAGGLFLAVGRANDLVGPGRLILGRSVTEAFELRSPPTGRASSIVGVLGGRAWWYDARPRGAPDVPVLGDPGLLVHSFRRELVTARDVALAEAAADGTRAEPRREP